MKKKPEDVIFELKTNDDAVDFLINKIYKGWVERNPEIEKDILKLASDIVFFNIKWGTNIKL